MNGDDVAARARNVDGICARILGALRAGFAPICWGFSNEACAPFHCQEGQFGLLPVDK